MIGIADLAGGDWPKRARDLALEASKPDRRATDEMYSVLILGDLRDLFIKEAMEKRFSPTGDRIPSAQLCMFLGAMPERPWPSYGRSRALITQNKVADLLNPFEILPKTIWCTEKKGKEVVKTTPRSSRPIPGSLLPVGPLLRIQNQSPDHARSCGARRVSAGPAERRVSLSVQSGWPITWLRL